MRANDLSPLYRATVGFDRMMKLIDSANRVDESAFSYPPYNIEKTGDDAYQVTMAVAGFGEGDLDVTVKESSLVVTGKKEKAEAEEVKYLHRGIATRSFERRFDLADHIRVVGARLENGLLFVDLVREIPEAMKPRSIHIESLNGKTAIESAAA
ncbi:MAG: Hsp20 family protein [Pseudomonadota bacterium]